LPPGITDPNDPTAIPLASGIVAANVDQQVQWTGHDGVDTNNISISSEGVYSFTIQATSTATNKTTLYRGVVQLYR